MPFVTEDDYIVISSDALKIVQQCDAAKRAVAETSAQEEISSYLRGRYDVAAIFAVQSINRNMQIVMYFCDIVLYNLVCSLPQKMGYEMRKERYERAIKWLEGVQKGNVMPDLPTLTSNGQEDINNPIRYNCGQKNNYDW